MEKDDLQNFPKLSEDELRDLTLGVYQIKQAKSYTQEHLNTDGKYEFSINKEDTGMIRLKYNLVTHHPRPIFCGYRMAV